MGGLVSNNIIWISSSGMQCVNGDIFILHKRRDVPLLNKMQKCWLTFKSSEYFIKISIWKYLFCCPSPSAPCIASHSNEDSNSGKFYYAPGENKVKTLGNYGRCWFSAFRRLTLRSKFSRHLTFFIDFHNLKTHRLFTAGEARRWKYTINPHCNLSH